MTATTATKSFQTINAAIEASSWTRLFYCPNYTIFTNPEGDREITVWYFRTGNLEGAQLAKVGDDPQADFEVLASVKRNGLDTVLGWIAA